MAGGIDESSGVTLPGRILDALRRRGEAAVVRWKRYGLWQPVSGRELADRIDRIANGLRAQGLLPGEVAAVIGDNCLEWMLADLAIGAAGGVSAGLDPHGDADELARVISEYDARVLMVCGDDQLHKALAIRERCPGLRLIVAMHQQWDDGAGAAGVMALSALEAAAKADTPVVVREADDAAVIITSSGSTGPVRGAVLGHRAIVSQAERAMRTLRLREDDERLSLSPLHHVLERVVGLYASLLAGTVVYFAESRDTAFADLVELQPTVVQASPQLFARLRAGIVLTMADTTRFQRWALSTALAMRVKRSPLRGLSDALVLGAIRRRIGLGRARLCLSCGAPTHRNVADWFTALGRPLSEVYGQAEAGGAVRIAADHVLDWKLASDGELWLRGASLFQGYAGRGAATVPADGWWRSGDIARPDEASGFIVLGRVAHVLHRNGERVLPFEAEHALKDSPYIADAFLALDAQGRVAARVLLDPDHTIRYAQDHGIPFTHFQSLCARPEIRALVTAVIADVNRRHAAIEISAFALIERALQPGDAEMAPSLTLRRHLLGDDEPGPHAEVTRPEFLKDHKRIAS